MSQQYWQKLQDPRWQRKRLEVLQRDDFRCRDCGDTTKMLQVHHAYYVSGREPWEYPDAAYETLCYECHKARKAPDNQVPQPWEVFKGIEDDNVRASGCSSGFDVAILNFARICDEPVSEILNLFTEAMDENVIDKESMINWRTALKTIRIEREKRHADAASNDAAAG